MALHINHVTNDISVTGGKALIDGAQGAMEVIEYADLTHGGLNDWASYDLSHTMEAGYNYFMYISNLDSDTASWQGYLWLRNDAGTWLTSSGDYYSSWQGYGASSSANSQSGTAARLTRNASSIPADAHTSIWSTIYAPMDTAVQTNVVSEGKTGDDANSSAGGQRVSASTNIADGHDQLRVGVSTGLMNSGEVFLWRVAETT